MEPNNLVVGARAVCPNRCSEKRFDQWCRCCHAYAFRKLLRHEGAWEKRHDREAAMAMLRGALERHHEELLAELDRSLANDVRCLTETYESRRQALIKRHLQTLNTEPEITQGSLC